MSVIDELEKMRKLIEEMRSRLHDQAKGRCFCDPEVIQSSQELNKVLNEYERLLVVKCKGRNDDKVSDQKNNQSN